MIQTGEGPLSTNDRSVIGEALRDNRVVAFPTSTFYGLAVNPFSSVAVDHLLNLKHDRQRKPIPLVLAGIANLETVVVNPPALLADLAARFWPGPLTVIAEAAVGLPRALLAGGNTVGIRVPKHCIARQVADLAGGVVTATSANPSGERSPVSAEEVLAYFAETDILIIDAGATPGGRPSTIIDLLTDPPKIVRTGAIEAEKVFAVIGAPRSWCSVSCSFAMPSFMQASRTKRLANCAVSRSATIQATT